MIQEYLNKAMETAHYQLLEDSNEFYGCIPNAPGVNLKQAQISKDEWEEL